MKLILYNETKNYIIEESYIQMKLMNFFFIIFRYIQKMFLRGDSVIIVVKNPLGNAPGDS